jgi:hypothetical protein
MLIVRFRAGDATRYGALEGPVVVGSLKNPAVKL